MTNTFYVLSIAFLCVSCQGNRKAPNIPAQIEAVTMSPLPFMTDEMNENGRTNVTDLYGFRLGQFRKTATNEFGEPFIQDKDEDGIEYEMFLLKPDTSLYLVFLYDKKTAEKISSIQITGNDTTSDVGFKGFRLGMDKNQVEQILGKPDFRDDVGDYGEQWSYENANYSIEISKNGRLSSVKIWDNYSGFIPDTGKLPNLENIIEYFNSESNADIVCILAPDMEIYYRDQTLFFGKSLKTEIETDYSKIFHTIREIGNGLNRTTDQNSYELNMRFQEGTHPKFVMKINIRHTIREIVFDYMNGQYLIWEIDTQ